MPRSIKLLVISLPTLLLAGWFFITQWPLWTAAQSWWITPRGADSAPAGCEAAGLLRALGASRAFGETAINAADAERLARAVLVEAYGDLPAGLPAGGPGLVQVTVGGTQRTAWIITTALAARRVDASGIVLPYPAAVVLVDAATGDILELAHAANAGDAARDCPFPLRTLVVNALRSAPFVGMAVYLGAVFVLGASWLVVRRMRR